MERIKRLQCAPLAPSTVFPSLSHEVVHPLHMRPPAVQLSTLIKLNDEESAVRTRAISVEVGLYPKDRPLL